MDLLGEERDISSEEKEPESEAPDGRSRPRSPDTEAHLPKKNPPFRL